MFTTRAGVPSQLVDLICAIDARKDGSQHPVRVAIDGVDGAGKATLADELAPLCAWSTALFSRSQASGAGQYNCG